MRKLTLFAFFAVAAVAVLSAPPAHADAKCGNDICQGSAGTQVHTKGNAIFDRPILPGATTLLIDGGVGINGAVNITGATTIAGTLTTAGVTSSGTYSPAVIDAGTMLIRADGQVVGALTVGGTTTLAGAATGPGTWSPAVIDAGTALFRGDVQVAGQLNLQSPIHCGADVACGTVALSSGTPSTATKTVTSGSTCACFPVGNSAAIAAGGCAASVSSTTATFTGPNTVTTTVMWLCTK